MPTSVMKAKKLNCIHVEQEFLTRCAHVPGRWEEIKGVEKGCEAVY